MKLTKKRALIISCLSLPVILLLGLILLIDPALEAGVETGATQGLGTPTTLDSASLSFLAGTITLTNLVVSNPQGFREPEAFRTEKIGVDVSVPSLFSDTIRIEDITVNSPHVTLEVTRGGSNLGRLLKSTPSDEEVEGSSAPAATSKHLHIERIQIMSARVLIPESELVRKRREISLGTIELRDLEDDITVAELARRILAAIVAETSREAGLPPAVAEQLGGLDLPGLESVEDAVQDVKKGLESILGGTKGD